MGWIKEAIERVRKAITKDTTNHTEETTQQNKPVSPPPRIGNDQIDALIAAQRFIDYKPEQYAAAYELITGKSDAIKSSLEELSVNARKAAEAIGTISISYGVDLAKGRDMTGYKATDWAPVQKDILKMATNNWRKMHGYPLKRKVKQYVFSKSKKNKRA